MTPDELREKVARGLCANMCGPIPCTPPLCEGCLDAATAAIAVVLEEGMSEWQPIETAPKDGKPFLAWNGHWRGVAMYYDPAYLDDPEWVDESTQFIEPQPTHWMPLPPPPETRPYRGQQEDGA